MGPINLTATARHYKKYGWAIGKAIIEPALIERAREVALRIDHLQPDLPLPEGLQGFLAREPGQPRSARANQYIAHQYAAIRNLCLHPSIGRIAAELCGSRSVRLFNSALILKPRGESAAYSNVGWHCDQAYWLTCTSSRMLTAWIPLQSSSTENGTLQVMSGSHLPPRDSSLSELWRSKSFLTRNHDAVAEKLSVLGSPYNVVPMELASGSVSFHHMRTLHASQPNTSAEVRCAISVHIQDEDNEYHFAKEAYVHDEHVRKNSQNMPDYRDPDICPVIWPPQACEISDSNQRLR